MSKLHLSAKQRQVLWDMSGGSLSDERMETWVGYVRDFLDDMQEAKTVGERREALEGLKCYGNIIAEEAADGLDELKVFNKKATEVPLDAWKQAEAEGTEVAEVDGKE